MADFVLQMAAHTEKGRRRKNEDNYICLALPHPYVRVALAVADGMGGEAGGGKASRIAVQVFKEFFLSLPKNSANGRELLQRVYRRINNRIFSSSKKNPTLEGMGTTLVSALILGNTLFAANVGDSRIYRISQGAVTQISEDHNMLTKLLQKGKPKSYLRRKEEYLSSCLLRSLGEPAPPKVDVFPKKGGGFPLVEGDVYLLCSDGLTGSLFTPFVRPGDMVEIVESSPTLEEACQKLVTLAYERGSDDNITVVLLKVAKKRSYTGSVRLTLRKNGR